MGSSVCGVLLFKKGECGYTLKGKPYFFFFFKATYGNWDRGEREEPDF